jgi:hypothetical protein
MRPFVDVKEIKRQRAACLTCIDGVQLFSVVRNAQFTGDIIPSAPFPVQNSTSEDKALRRAQPPVLGSQRPRTADPH